MNIKILTNIIIIVVILSGCGKKNSKQGEDFYKYSLIELQRNDQKALYFIEKALELDSQARYYSLKGTLMFKFKKYIKSERNLKIALDKETNPKLRADILNNYACLLVQMGRKSEAMKIWDALEKDKYYLTPEAALFNQAKVLIKEKKYKEAKNKLVKATMYAPEYTDAHYYLALIAYNNLKDYILAQQEAKKTIQLEPLHLKARSLLYSITDKSVTDKSVKEHFGTFKANY